MSQQYPFQCNIAQALNIIGDKWSLLILHGIMSGHQTYKEIYNSLEGQIASNLLSSRLTDQQRFIPEASAPLPLYTYTCWRGFEYRF